MLGEVPVLVHEGENIYRIDNTKLKADTLHLEYHSSKALDDKQGPVGPLWGARVEGTDEGDGWVKVFVDKEMGIEVSVFSLIPSLRPLLLIGTIFWAVCVAAMLPPPIQEWHVFTGMSCFPEDWITDYKMSSANIDACKATAIQKGSDAFIISRGGVAFFRRRTANECKRNLIAYPASDVYVFDQVVPSPNRIAFTYRALRILFYGWGLLFALRMFDTWKLICRIAFATTDSRNVVFLRVGAAAIAYMAVSQWTYGVGDPSRELFDCGDNFCFPPEALDILPIWRQLLEPLKRIGVYPPFSMRLYRSVRRIVQISAVLLGAGFFSRLSAFVAALGCAYIELLRNSWAFGPHSRGRIRWLVAWALLLCSVFPELGSTWSVDSLIARAPVKQRRNVPATLTCDAHVFHAGSPLCGCPGQIVLIRLRLG